MEKFSKKRRGRPKTWHDIELEAGRAFTTGLSERSARNGASGAIALYVLEKRRERIALDTGIQLTWLIDEHTGRMKRTILTALGRIENFDWMAAVAARICRDRMKVSEALAFIKSFPPPDTK